MRVLSLTPDDAAEVERLAQRIHPDSFHLSQEDIAENLEGVEEEGCNFCLGVHDEERMVGYLLAWVDNTLVEGRAEDVVLVDDLALLPAARNQLFPVLRALLRSMEEAGCAEFPIEGTVRKELEDTFTSHPDIFASLGYRLAASHEYSDESVGETLVWIRFEPVDGPRRRFDSDADEYSDDLDDLFDPDEPGDSSDEA